MIIHPTVIHGKDTYPIEMKLLGTKIRFLQALLVIASILGLMFIMLVIFGPSKTNYFTSPNDEVQESSKQGSRGISHSQNTQNKEDKDLVVLYNRVPKTGSTSFMKVTYDLCKKNRFSAVYVNVTKRPMSLADESWLVHNITRWRKVRPVVFHGHFSYVNFAKFGSSTNPLFINVIRDPLQRLVSFYYFMRYGDDFRPNKIRKRMGDKTTFDECVKNKGADCRPELLWLQIPFLCGHSPRCWSPGSKWALEQAKRHVVDSYYLVGVLEEMEKFVKILEHTLPRIFQGATKSYLKGGGVHVRKTKQKKPISKETIDYFKGTKIWKLENELYQFVRGVIMKQFDAMFKQNGAATSAKKSRILYQKVKLIFHQ